MEPYGNASYHALASPFKEKRKRLGHIKVPDPFISSKQATQLSEFGQVLDSIIIFSAIKGISFNCGYKRKFKREIIIRISDAYRRGSKSRIRSELVLQGVLCEQLIYSGR